jgi:hypothetical protein
MDFRRLLQHVFSYFSEDNKISGVNQKWSSSTFSIKFQTHPANCIWLEQQFHTHWWNFHWAFVHPHAENQSPIGLSIAFRDATLDSPPFTLLLPLYQNCQLQFGVGRNIFLLVICSVQLNHWAKCTLEQQSHTHRSGSL